MARLLQQGIGGNSCGKTGAQQQEPAASHAAAATTMWVPVSGGSVARVLAKQASMQSQGMYQHAFAPNMEGGLHSRAPHSGSAGQAAPCQLLQQALAVHWQHAWLWLSKIECRGPPVLKCLASQQIGPSNLSLHQPRPDPPQNEGGGLISGVLLPAVAAASPLLLAALQCSRPSCFRLHSGPQLLGRYALRQNSQMRVATSLASHLLHTGPN